MKTALAVLIACAVLVVLGTQPESTTPFTSEFMRVINDTLREEFLQIVRNKTLSPDEKMEAVLKWAKPYGLEKLAKEHVLAWRKAHPNYNKRQ
ncbi:hypothetical protein GCK32_020917 [Trichostrongylus colubriformis]|uniref:Uncharacterized protein n=1 Tax=Trichostrongylus colubriformis TaxID=6319 RepID=A0AAN8IW45_TRICO